MEGTLAAARIRLCPSGCLRFQGASRLDRVHLKQRWVIMGGALEPPLVSLAVTHVYYRPNDLFSLISAYLALIPQALMVIYVTLIYSRREIEVLLMFSGQLLCELANWILKRLIKEERPKGKLIRRACVDG